MITTVEALKQLYVSFGGSAEEVINLVTIPDMIEALASLETTSKPLIVNDDGNGNVEIKLGEV